MNTTGAPSLLRGIAGIILLLVQLAGPLQGLPLIAAAVVALDGEHGVEISSRQTGLCVVLHHDRNDMRDHSLPLQHRHRGVIRLLAGAESDGPHPDHFLQFTSASAEWKASEETSAVSGIDPEPRSDCDADVVHGPAAACAPQTANASPHRLHRWWPPAPSECAWGFVVLLI